MSFDQLVWFGPQCSFELCGLSSPGRNLWSFTFPNSATSCELENVRSCALVYVCFLGSSGHVAPALSPDFALGVFS